MVVKEFWPAVPESGFILVALENELFPTAEPVTLAKVFRYTPHKKIRPFRRGVKNPGEHRRGGRFSMGSADDDGMSLGRKTSSRISGIER